MSGNTTTVAQGLSIDDVLLRDEFVRRMFQSGASFEATLVAIAVERERLVKRILELESIAPRKIQMPNGEVFVWRCPDSMIPTINNP